MGIFIFSWSSLKNFKNFNEYLSNRGFYIEGAFPIFDSYNFISSGRITKGNILFIIKKGKPRDIFVGELNSNIDFIEKLVKNFKKRKRGSIPQLGFFIEPKFYTSFHRLVVNKTIQDLIQKRGYKKYNLNKLALEKNEKVKRERKNAIYVSGSLVKHTFKEISEKIDKYTQYVLDPELASSYFVVKFLKTSLGKRILDPLRPIYYSPDIELSDKKIKKFIYLPSIKKQFEIVKIDKKISKYMMFLKNLRIQLWENLEDLNNIQDVIDKIKIEGSIKKRMVGWIEKLPYPLASILWLYLSEDNIEHKIDHLFHFFEALVIYISMIFLNIFANNEKFYRKNKQKWVEKDSKHKNWIEKPTLGSWVFFGKKLSLILKKFLNKNEKDFYIQNFRVPKEFLLFLCEDEKYELFKRVNEYRNLWKGHGGVASDKEKRRRFQILENLLLKCQRLISDFLQDLQLIIAGTMKLQEGLFHIKVKRIIGSRTPFPIDTIITLEPMEKGKLYFKHKEKNRAIPIKVPLLKIV